MKLFTTPRGKGGKEVGEEEEPLLSGSDEEPLQEIGKPQAGNSRPVVPESPMPPGNHFIQDTG